MSKFLLSLFALVAAASLGSPVAAAEHALGADRSEAKPPIRSITEVVMPLWASAEVQKYQSLAYDPKSRQYRFVFIGKDGAKRQVRFDAVTGKMID
jgi:hypothetical protein